MNIETLREYCLGLTDVEETTPFDADTLVYKVGGKMFLLASIDETPLRFSVKCDPDRAQELRETYASVIPGFHLNKQHWNTVILDGEIPDRELREFVDHSYSLVAPKPKKTTLKKGVAPKKTAAKKTVVKKTTTKKTAAKNTRKK